MTHHTLNSMIPDEILPAQYQLKKGDTLIIASHNKGKVKEIEVLLAPFGLKIICAGDLNLPEPDETEATFVGNALIKAHGASKASNLPALSDDSGMCVYALNGDPGVYSARWAGETKDFGIAMQKVEDALQGHSDRRAFFVATLALAFPDGTHGTFTGTAEGVLTWPPKGENGFGYDAMFIPSDDPEKRTMGEMSSSEKKAISHRTKAFEKFLKSGVFSEA